MFVKGYCLAQDLFMKDRDDVTIQEEHQTYRILNSYLIMAHPIRLRPQKQFQGRPLLTKIYIILYELFTN
jgi:hypothetical protein